MSSHVVTALSGFLDKGAAATFGSLTLLGLYTPLAEFSARAGALAGGIASFFLRNEAWLACAASSDTQTSASHRSVIRLGLTVACLLVLLATFTIEWLLELLLGKTTHSQVLAARLLLACLTLNIGAHWSAVALKARARFDLFRPYTTSLCAGLVLAPWLISKYDIVGAALVALLVRTADVFVLIRAGRFIGREHETIVFVTTSLIVGAAFFETIAA